MGACTYESTVYTHTCTLSLIDYSENACVCTYGHACVYNVHRVLARVKTKVGGDDILCVPAYKHAMNHKRCTLYDITAQIQ